MAILPSVLHYILSEETDVESPVSEALNQKFGEAINYLNDLSLNNYQFFDTVGANAYTIPKSVTRVVVFGCGGGGSGGQGRESSSSPGSGGGGGAGSPYIIVPRVVVPEEPLTITVGAGGSNSDGGATTINFSVGGTLTMHGGFVGTTALNPTSAGPGGQRRPGGAAGGNGGRGSPGSAGSNGEYSMFFTPGSGGAGFSDFGGGGGGGAGFGGNGGNGAIASSLNTGTNSTAGQGYGAGGGGGRAIQTGGSAALRAGANGFQGFCVIIF
jgi:hypothetical protein